VSVDCAHKHHHLGGLNLAHWKLPAVSCFVVLFRGLRKASVFQTDTHTHSWLACFDFRKFLPFLLLGMLLRQLNTRRDCFLHSLDHLRFLQLQLPEFLLLNRNHLLLTHHFLVQTLLIAYFAQFSIQELALLEVAPLLSDSFGLLEVSGHLQLLSFNWLLAPLLLALKKVFNLLALLLILKVASFNLNVFAHLKALLYRLSLLLSFTSLFQ